MLKVTLLTITDVVHSTLMWKVRSEKSMSSESSEIRFFRKFRVKENWRNKMIWISTKHDRRCFHSCVDAEGLISPKTRSKLGKWKIWVRNLEVLNWNSFTGCGRVKGQGQSHSGLSTKINLPWAGMEGSNEKTEGWSEEKRSSLPLLRLHCSSLVSNVEPHRPLTFWVKIKSFLKGKARAASTWDG